MVKKEEIVLPEDVSELRYVDAVRHLQGQKLKEDIKGHMLNKFKQNPFVPIGIIATSVILARGLGFFFKRDSHNQQLMMRGRIGAQFCTFAVCIAGAAYYEWKGNKEIEVEDNYSKFDDI